MRKMLFRIFWLVLILLILSTSNVLSQNEKRPPNRSLFILHILCRKMFRISFIIRIYKILQVIYFAFFTFFNKLLSDIHKLPESNNEEYVPLSTPAISGNIKSFIVDTL